MRPRSPEKTVVSKQMGIRERAKQESQHKIMTAARHLFAEVGFDRATLRQIAARAGLSAGALFNHVTDKRDLIYLIFNEEVDAITEAALASPRSYQNFQEKILTITEPYFRLFATEPVLSRILLNEIAMETPGLHLERNLQSRARLVDGIAQLAAQAQEAGEIDCKESPERIALHIFFTYAASLRRWLSSSAHPEWRSGQQEYQRFLAMQIEGLGRKAAPVAATTAKLPREAAGTGNGADRVARSEPSSAEA